MSTEEPRLDEEELVELSTSVRAAGTSGSERRRVVSGGVWNAASTVLPMGSTLLLSVLISHRFGAAGLGAQSLIAYSATLLNALLILSFTAASLQILGAARGEGDDSRTAWLARYSLIAHTTGGVFSALVLVGVGLFSDTFRVAWYVVGLTALLDAVSWALSSRIAARDGWSAVGARRLVSQLCAPLLGVGALAAGFGITGVFWGQAIASAGLLLALRPVALRHPSRIDRSRPVPDWRPLLRVWGLFVLSVVITQIVERRLELLFLGRFSTKDQVAYYSTAFNLVSIAFIICSSVTGAAVPSIAAAHGAKEHGKVTEALNRATSVIVVIGMMLAAGLAAVGPALIELAYPRDFAAAARLVPFLAISLLLAPLGHLYNAYWTGIGSLRPVLLCGAAGAVIDVAVAVALIDRFGARGAVAANVAGQCSAALLVAGYTWRRERSLRVPLPVLARSAAVALVAAAAGAVVARLGGWQGVAGGTLAYGLAALLAAKTIGLLAARDADWLAGALPGRAGGLLQFLTRPGRVRRAP